MVFPPNVGAVERQINRLDVWARVNGNRNKSILRRAVLRHRLVALRAVGLHPYRKGQRHARAEIGSSLPQKLKVFCGRLKLFLS